MSTQTSDISGSAAPASASAIVNIDAEIQRAAELLNALKRQKEAQANEQLKARDSAILDFQKRYKLDPRGLLTVLKAFEDAGRLIGAKTDADLGLFLTQLGEMRASIGVPSNRDLAIVIRNRSVSSSKAKRLDKPTLELIREVLKRGAKVPEVAKHFGLAEATVNARKKAWKLTHRPGVKLVPLKEALKGLV